eukprot:g16373.t1
MSTSAAMRTFTYKYHAGKLAVQRRAGTVEEAARILNSGFVGTKISSSGESQLADPDMREVYLSSVDREGLVWASVVGGAPGFVSEAPSPINPGSLQVAIDSGNRGFLTYEGDPLDENLQRPDAPVGMLIMSYKNRRRYRINGKIVSTTGGGSNDIRTPLSRVALEIVMAMGNCPKYLHVRNLVREEGTTPRNPALQRSTTLSEKQRDWIASSDTFTLSTYAVGPYGGADASNRGGNPGFVRALDDRTIVFPDYKGNNMYLSLGNIVANPRAGLLFIDRETGDILQVSGEARIVYAEEASGGGDPALSGSTGKYVRIHVLAVVEARAASPLRMRMEELSPYSPAVPPPPQHQQRQQQQRQVGSFLVRCTEALDVASGVKAFRFELAEPATAEVARAQSNGNGNGQGKALAWIPGQYATFFFPSCEGAGCGEGHEGLYSLPILPSLEGGVKGEVVVRTWTITSVCGNNGPLEITVQAKAGGVSEHLHADLKPGAVVRVTVGGDFTLTDRLGTPPPLSRTKVLLLSAGIGVTPMIAALRWLRQQRGAEAISPDVVAVHAARTACTVPFLAEIVEQATRATASGTPADAADVADKAAPTRVRFVLAVTGGAGGNDRNEGGAGGAGAMSAGKKDSTDDSSEQRAPSTCAAHVKNTTMGVKDQGCPGPAGTEAVAAAASTPHFYTVEGRPDATMLRREVPDIADRHVLLCGPGVFMTAMDEAMKELGVPSSRIHSEEFSF